MYLKTMVLENMGPLKKININFEINEIENPKPLILVGENGSGKSFLLSSIVDSLHEFARQSYNDITNHSSSGAYMFKSLSSSNIKIGSEYYYAYLKFENLDSKKYQYIEKSGNITQVDLESKIGEKLIGANNWKEGNHKWTTVDKDNFKNEFQNNSYCFFPPFRYEVPSWLIEESIGNDKFKLQTRNAGILNKPLLISNILEENKGWFLDVIMDSRVDIIKNETGGYNAEQNLGDAEYLRIARKNIEEVLSKIIGHEVIFKINYRNNYNGRFSIINTHDKEIFVNSLEGLSTGQLAIFNIFSTIVKYSDYSDLHKGVKLNEIKGIIVIDEIDLHLHSKLLREVLPQLIKLFPKVQFIITSHSPLFLLGMEEVFGENGVSIVELPTGEKINSERFSQFEESFNYYKATKEFEESIKARLVEELEETTKPLIVTEGKTDWKHFKAALNYFQLTGEFTDLDINFLEYENNLKMNDSELKSFLTHSSKAPRENKVIGIFDSDSSTGKSNQTPLGYKEYSKNFYGLCIETPEFRKGHQGISVEHLYLNEDLKKEDSEGRRIYLSSEFTEKGRFKEDKTITYENASKIKKNLESTNDKILDTDISNIEEESIALSKDDFAKNILNKMGDFSEMNFEGFRSSFEKIKSIIDLS